MCLGYASRQLTWGLLGAYASVRTGCGTDEIVDEDGGQALTMRRLGQALGRNPMAIYRHAADKDALLDGLLERVVSDLAVPGETGHDGQGDWETVLRRIAHAFRRLTLLHPNAVSLLVTDNCPGHLLCAPWARCGPWSSSSSYSPAPGSIPTLRCTRLDCSPASSTVTSWSNWRNRSRPPRKPTTCFALDYIGCPSRSSRGCDPWPPFGPATTVPPNSIWA